MSSFNTRITSLKTKASVGVRAANVLRECERMEKQNTYLKTLLSEANDTEMFNHVLDSHLEAIANMIPEFKTGAFFKKPVKTTLVNPITDKITILRDFIRHSTTSGMGIDYKFPEKRQVEIERQSQENAQQAQQDRTIVQCLEDIARARAQTATQPQPFGATATTPRTYQFPFGTQPSAQATGVHQSGVHHSGVTPFRGFGAHPSVAQAPSVPPFGFGAQQTQSVPPFGFGAQQTQSVPPAFGVPVGYAPPTYTGLDKQTFSVPRQTPTSPTTGPVTTGPVHPPIKKPRFATAPKRTKSAQKQATTEVTQQVGASTLTSTTTVPPKQ